MNLRRDFDRLVGGCRDKFHAGLERKILVFSIVGNGYIFVVCVAGVDFIVTCYRLEVFAVYFDRARCDHLAECLRGEEELLAPSCSNTLPSNLMSTPYHEPWSFFSGTVVKRHTP